MAELAALNLLGQLKKWVRDRLLLVDPGTFAVVAATLAFLAYFADAPSTAWWLLLPVAFLAHPPVPAGLVLLVLSARRDRNLVTARTTGQGQARKSALIAAYRAQDQFERASNWMQSKLRAGHFAGHWLLEISSILTTPGDGLNATNTATSGIELEKKRSAARRIRLICQFALAAMRYEDAKSQHAGLLAEFVEAIPSGWQYSKVRDSLLATFYDREGTLSTLNFLYLIHVTLSMAPTDTDPVVLTFDQLRFDPSVYGWLSSRVFQLVLNYAVCGQAPITAILQRVQPFLDQISNELTSASDSDDLYLRQYAARNQILSIVRCSASRKTLVQ